MDKVRGTMARNYILLYFGGYALLGVLVLIVAGIVIRRVVKSSGAKK